jgi:integral membrane protein
MGLIESISFILLVFIAMPLKYLAGITQAVSVVGAIHGGLWILYVLALGLAWMEQKWSISVVFLGLIASMLPFGPQVFDAKVLATQR